MKLNKSEERIMKKLLTLLVVMGLSTVFVGCGNSEEATPTDSMNENIEEMEENASDAIDDMEQASEETMDAIETEVDEELEPSETE